MGKKKMPRSLRKFIRKEKARIRREVLDIGEQNRLISELYQRLLGKSEVAVEKKSKIKNPAPPSGAGRGQKSK